jgi:hypothetical protein
MPNVVAVDTFFVGVLSGISSVCHSHNARHRLLLNKTPCR